MSKMFFDKCGGCCKNDCNKKEGDKSGSFGSNQEKIQEGGSMNKAPFDKSNDNNKKENGKPEQNQGQNHGQNQGKWQEKSNKNTDFETDKKNIKKENL